MAQNISPLQQLFHTALMCPGNTVVGPIMKAGRNGTVGGANDTF